jgi:hypothetical protein
MLEPPCSPAMGVLQLPSSAARKARSVTTATRVSSWLSLARNLAEGSSSVLQDRTQAQDSVAHTCQQQLCLVFCWLSTTASTVTPNGLTDSPTLTPLAVSVHTHNT